MRVDASGHRSRALQRRATESGSVIVDSEPSLAPVQPSKVPINVPAIAGVLSALVIVIIMVFVAWKYRNVRRQKESIAPSLVGKVTFETEHYNHTEKNIDLENVSIYMEKPEKAIVTPNSNEDYAGWVPQIKSQNPYGLVVSVPEPTVPKQAVSRSSKSPMHLPSENSRNLTSPPPSYFVSEDNEVTVQPPRSIPIPLSPLLATTLPPTPPTPPANRKTKTSFVSLIEAPIPTPSPRSESFAAQDLIIPKQSNDAPTDEFGNLKLPRLMSVVASFSPNLDDELAIRLGDTVRMIEEYRDGWCLIQRVGKIDAPKGVAPRFCLQERRGIVPSITPTRKFSSGSLNAQAWR